MKETIEEFLARGGAIQHIPKGQSGVDWKSKPNRNIVISKKAITPDDPRSSRRQGNQSIFNKRNRQE